MPEVRMPMTGYNNMHKPGKQNAPMTKAPAQKATIRFAGEPEKPKTPEEQLREAARDGNVEKLKQLIRNGANLQETYQEIGFWTGHNRLTLMHEVAKQPNPHLKVIELLKAHGLSVRARESGSGWTPLHRYVYNYPNVEGLQTWLNKGADINAVDKDGNNALHIYANRWYVCSSSSPEKEVMEFLVDKGIDPHAKNRAGQTPLDLLRRRPDANFACEIYLSNVDKLQEIKRAKQARSSQPISTPSAQAENKPEKQETEDKSKTTEAKPSFLKRIWQLITNAWDSLLKFLRLRSKE
jgi:hypothetical protein